MSREDILGRIREALAVPTAGHAAPADPAACPVHAPRLSGDPDALWAAFAARSEALKTTALRAPDRAAAHQRLRALAAEEGWERVASHRARRTGEAAAALDLPVLWVDDDYEVDALEACPAGITTCAALVAQSGSVVVSPTRGGGRALSALPPHHVVLASPDDLVADLPAAFARLRGQHPDGWPSFLSVITGPSRTGDIERILVLGAHGPRRLTVLLIDEGGPP